MKVNDYVLIKTKHPQRLRFLNLQNKKTCSTTYIRHFLQFSLLIVSRITHFYHFSAQNSEQMPLFTPQIHLHLSICKQVDQRLFHIYTTISAKAKQDCFFSLHISKLKHSSPFNKSKRLFTTQEL